MIHDIGYVQSASCEEQQPTSAVCRSSEEIFSLFFLSVILLFYSETELLHNTAKKVGMRMGLIGTKKGVSFWFLLYVTNIIVLLKNTGFFFQHLCYLIPIVWHM